MVDVRLEGKLKDDFVVAPSAEVDPKDGFELPGTEVVPNAGVVIPGFGGVFVDVKTDRVPTSFGGL
jgi:hypothetical protein